MKISKMLTETFECVKINGILRNLSNDEMKIYKRVKNEGKLFKADLTEFEANVATSMVTKGLLRRKKSQQEQGKHGRIYYIARGRKGHLSTKEIDEVAPPGKEAESWIKKNKKRFKDRYGDGYEKYLYGKAWNNYNGKKKLKESINGYLDGYDNYSDKINVIRNKNASDEEVSKAIENARVYNDKINSYINDANIKLKENSSNVRGTLRDLTIHIVDYMHDKELFSNDENDIYISFDIEEEGSEESIFTFVEDEIRNYLKEEARSSGEYNQFRDREYDSDATWESICEVDNGDLVNRYIDNDDIDDYYNDILNNINNIIELSNGGINSGIAWNGDDTQTEEQILAYRRQQEEADRATIQRLMAPIIEFKEKISRYINDSVHTDNSINDVFDTVGTLYRDIENNFNEFVNYNEMRQSIHECQADGDRLYERAKESAQESGDFDQYYEEEIDDDATEEAILEDTECDWVRSIWGQDSHLIRLLLKYNTILEKIAEQGSNEGIPSGEEFNECVLYENFNPEVNYDFETIRIINEIKNSENSNAKSVLRTFIRWFAYEFDSVFDDDIDEKNIKDLVSCLDEEEQYTCYVKLKSLYYNDDAEKRKPPKKVGDEYNQDM